MKHMYYSVGLIVLFINAEIFGADYAHKQMPSRTQSQIGARYQEEINLFDVAQKILDEVLQFDLRTANSVASNCYDDELLIIMREKSPVPICYDEYDTCVYFLDEVYNRAKKSLECGVANCGEYSQIGAIIFLEMIYHYPCELSFKCIVGENFDHEYIAIGRRHEDLNQWVVIDPWLRKVFSWNETIDHLKQAGVNPNFGSEYKYKVVTIFDRQGNYHPAKYNLRTIKKLIEDKSRSILLALNGMYNVPYESQQKYYDPETKVMTIGSKISVRVRKKT